MAMIMFIVKVVMHDRDGAAVSCDEACAAADGFGVVAVLVASLLIS